MIAGLGTDIVEVDRIAIHINKGNGFKELVFSKHEIEYCESKAHPLEHYAARFAAKEALFKALGTGWFDRTSFNEVEIRNDREGKPEIYFLGKTKDAIHTLNIDKFFVSLSHVKSLATAVVILEKLKVK